MNKVETLAFLLGDGGKTKIARMCEVQNSLVTRWAKRGHISAGYLVRMKRGLAEYAEENRLGEEWLNSAVRCLSPDICPSCRREM